MPRYRLEHEFDDEPDYIFGPEEDNDPVVTVAAGNHDLAKALLRWLNTFYTSGTGE